MNADHAVTELTATLTANGVDESRLIAEYAVAEIIGTARLKLFQNSTQQLSQDQLRLYRTMSERLARHEPLQYVLGYTVFCVRRFQVDQRALIPRPETEELVAHALANDVVWALNPIDVIDVGTGTGCIAVTIAIERPNARVAAIDSSQDALALARLNADTHGAGNILFFHSDLLADRDARSADLIVSNPPYIPHPEISGLAENIRDYEPHQALDGGADGLRVLERLIADAGRVLRPNGWIYLEIGEQQGPAVNGMLASRGFKGIEIIRDFAERDRIAVARLGVRASSR